VGRDDVLRDIRAALEDQEISERVTILTGIKGSGKSAILAEMRAGLDPSRIAIFDLEEGLPVGPASDSVFFFDDVSRDIPGLGAFVADFARRMQEGEDLRLILAGLPHVVDELLKDGELSLLRKARRIILGNVHVDEALSLYTEALADRKARRSADNSDGQTGSDSEGQASGTEKGKPGDTGKKQAGETGERQPSHIDGTERGGELDDDTPNNILQRAAIATAGYPYMIQLVGYYLFKEDKPIDDIVADKAIFLAKTELYKNIHDPFVWSLSSKDRMFLWAMAQDEGASEFGEIARRMNVSAGYASKYRERLINAGVIYSSAYGELAFTLPFMKEYIEKEYIERLGGEGGKRRL